MSEADPFVLAQKEHPQIDIAPSLFRAHWDTCVGITNERAADIWLALGIAHGNDYALNWLKQWVHREAQKLPRVKIEQQWTSEVESRTLRIVAVKVDDALPKIANYRGRGPLQAWLRTVLIRTARAMIEKHPAVDNAEIEKIALGSGRHDDLEQEVLKNRFRGLLGPALRAAAGRLSSKERALIAMHYIDELSIDEIGAAYQIHRATAARWLNQARAHFLEATRDSVAQAANVGRLEVDSLIRHVKSHLDLSLRAVLETQR